MPWFGKVEIVGGIKIGEGEKIKELVSEKVEYFMIPVREIIAVLFIMLVIVILMWRKKHALNNKIDGFSWVKYKVKRGENIINIAYRYGISWKELVYRNDIKPPYTLISGNVIMVPPRPKKVFKNTFMQNKNNLDNFENSDNPDESFYSDQIKINVKSDSDSSYQQEAESSHQQKRSVDEIGAGNFNFDDSEQINPEINPQVASIRRRKSFSGERTQKVNLKRERQQHFTNTNHKQPPRKDMDIRWMHEDDETFSEAMQDEVKAINFKIKIFVIIIIALVGGVGYWFYEYGMQEEIVKETASINDLLNNSESGEEEGSTDEINANSDGSNFEADESDEMTDEDNNNDTDENNTDLNSDNDEDGVIADNDDNDLNNDITDPSEVSVKVLNGGAKSGVAGDLTNLLKNKLYNTKTAANANNNVAGVVVYYKSGLDKEATELSKIVPQVYGATTLEESDDVVNVYGVDVIVVVGK